MRRGVLLALLPLSSALLCIPAAGPPVRLAAAVWSRRAALAPRMGPNSDKIAQLEEQVAKLEADGLSGAWLGALKGQIQDLKVADVEDQIDALRASVGKVLEDAPAAAAAAAAPPPPAAPAPAAATPAPTAAPASPAAAPAAAAPAAAAQPEAPQWRALSDAMCGGVSTASKTASFSRFPAPEALGVDGVRCAVVWYASDGIPKAKALLETFEDEAAEYAACGCALVAVRVVAAGDAADARKAAEYEDRFPSINFVDGLEALPAQREALGLDGDWERALYNEPTVLLLEPDGGVRLALSHKGLTAANVLGRVTRELHLAVPGRAGASISAAEAEANRQVLHDENVGWAAELEADESLRQPTRYWFDGVGAGRQKRPLLGGVESAALPAAIDAYLDGEGGEEVEEEEEELVSSAGVKAPSWYVKAKRGAERKQEAERLLWNGTAPSASAGPLPLGPAGARLVPLEGYTRKALSEAKAQQKKLVSSFLQSLPDELQRALPTAAAAEGAADGADGAPPAPRTASTESALLRAEMLALGLSRSSTSAASGRRLRLLRELEASVRELEAEGFNERAVLAPLKEQVRLSFASAPPEFIAAARKADPFSENLPTMSLGQIASAFADLAESNYDKASDGVEAAFTSIDWDSLKPNRERGPREKGNKIEIKRCSKD